MSGRGDEIDVLWHGEWALQRVLGAYGRLIGEPDLQTLHDLVAELQRIRVLRVQRQGARLRAKRRRRVLENRARDASIDVSPQAPGRPPSGHPY